MILEESKEEECISEGEFPKQEEGNISPLRKRKHFPEIPNNLTNGDNDSSLHIIQSTKNF